MNKILSILILNILTTMVNAQSYIVFERQIGINNHEFKPGLQLSQNEVTLKTIDTNLRIFNWYFSPTPAFKWSNLSTNVPITHDSITNQVLITAVPLITPRENLALRKLSLEEYGALTIISKEKLLEHTLKDFYFHFNQKRHLLPPLQTFEYGLIIKDKQDYYIVMQKVLVSRFIIRGDQWYFPNEFKSGVLNANTQIKTYQLKDILAIEKEMRSKKMREKIYNRIFVSAIDRSPEFNDYIFHFWEYRSDDVVSSLLDIPKLQEFNLGLGSFEFLPNVGIINCTLDAYIKRKISFNVPSYFKIRSINAVKLSDFQNRYKNSLNK